MLTVNIILALMMRRHLIDIVSRVDSEITVKYVK
jgi:hypothetical protein